VKRIDALFDIERTINSASADERLRVRQEQSAPLFAELEAWLPVERIWEYLKERYLSHRLLDDYDAIVEASSCAWNKLIAETGRLTSLTWLPWAPANAKSQNF
jgi:hypothetical protein